MVLAAQTVDGQSLPATPTPLPRRAWAPRRPGTRRASPTARKRSVSWSETLLACIEVVAAPAATRRRRSESWGTRSRDDDL